MQPSVAGGPQFDAIEEDAVPSPLRGTVPSSARPHCGPHDPCGKGSARCERLALAAGDGADPGEHGFIKIAERANSRMQPGERVKLTLTRKKERLEGSARPTGSTG